jgi:hypothetical protein
MRRRSHRRAIISFVLIIVLTAIGMPLFLITENWWFFILTGTAFGLVMLWQNVSDYVDERRHGSTTSITIEVLQGDSE